MKKINPIEKNAETINRHLGLKLTGKPKTLYDAAGHLIFNGGKRLRPYMVIKSCQIFNGKTSDALHAANAIEMVHNFTLVHDDIMDNDEMRHAVMTVHTKFGVPTAILAGDVLFSKAFQTVSNSKLDAKTNLQLVSILAKACVDVCEGQLLDIQMGEAKKIPTQSQYITMIGKKTAALFGVSCAMGATCATDNKKDISHLTSFGRNLGLAFQITDDIIGVTGDPNVTKKPVGNDIREGKKSLPILLAIKSAKGRDKEKLLKAFGNSKVSQRDLDAAVDVIRSLGIENIARGEALKYTKRAQRSLSTYSGTAKEELVALLDLVVKRSV